MRGAQFEVKNWVTGEDGRVGWVIVSTAELVPLLVSPEEFLAAEEAATERHEYVGGVIYAMAGAPERHNRIASKALVALGRRLMESHCTAYNSDMKVRVQMQADIRFYYPDVHVTCQQAPPDQMFLEYPVVIVEVVSESTRRTDEQEKRSAYLSIPSLCACVLLEQSRASAAVWRRHAGGFALERHEGLEATVELPEIEAVLPLAEVYRGVVFPGPGSDDAQGLR